MKTPTLAMWFLVVVIIGAAVAALHRPAHGHDIYGEWHPPGNPQTSCCHGQTEDGQGDCRPTRAYHDDEGWHAWDGYEYLTVPPERLLPTDLAGDGRSHLCEKGKFIYCFSPSEPKS